MYLPVCLFLIAGVASHANGSDSSPGMLGVTLRDSGGRVLVKDVHVGGPAYVAGLRPGDRIIAVGHKAVNTSTELREVLAENRANERVEVYASRDGWMKDLPITLAKREDIEGKPLLAATQTPQPRTRSGQVAPSRPIVHPDPAHRVRYERW
jgi:predicted metalloprotease with PDZ domain